MAVVEQVIEAAPVEAIGEAAVADVVEGAVFAELNGIDTTAGRDTGARTGKECFGLARSSRSGFGLYWKPVDNGRAEANAG